jgi:phosphonate transport system substrate-binding protein
MVMRRRALFAPLLLAPFLLGTATASAQTAAAPTPLRFAVTDIVGLENLQREWGPFQAALKELGGFDITFFAVPNRTAAVEALNGRRIDLVLTGPAEYVVFRVRSQAVPVVGLTRVDYYANIVVRADRPTMTLADLKGQRVGFGAVGSTSRHLGPMQIFADQGINPRTEIQPVHLATNVLLESLARGDLAAAGMNRTDFDRLRERNPGVAFRVIARGGDLPMDLILAGSHVDPAVVARLRETLAKHSDALIRAVLQGPEENRKFAGMHWVPTLRDEDYHVVRRMYGTIGATQFSEFVGN